jgi:electron transfer flavoprotein beta subunit
MRILVACKIVVDDQDIQVQADGSLDLSKAHQTVSTYDLNAIEAAVQLASVHEGSSVVAVSVGPAAIDDSKAKKNILARGVAELNMIADDSCGDLDARATAKALAGLIGSLGAYDLIICGDGSADNFAQQVDIQLAAELGIPVVNGVKKIEVVEATLKAERALEDVVEAIEVDLPAVISVVPDSALPRIPGMKDILAAGKKPMRVEQVDRGFENRIEILECKAPAQTDRRQIIWQASENSAITEFVNALKAAL